MTQKKNGKRFCTPVYLTCSLSFRQYLPLDFNVRAMSYLSEPQVLKCEDLEYRWFIFRFSGLWHYVVLKDVRTIITPASVKVSGIKMRPVTQER
jgi:hypothetical protein